MKRTLICLILALSTFFSMIACGEDEKKTGSDEAVRASQGLEYEKDKNNPYYIVTGIGTCTDEILCIPNEYNGLPVKEIGYEAFEYCKTIKKVIISEGIEVIGQYAFSGTDITGVSLPRGLKTIGDYAFLGSDLSSVDIPNGVTSIGVQAFSCCNSLKSVNIPDRVGIPNLHPLKNNGVF